jgi:hypothetical protein
MDVHQGGLSAAVTPGGEGRRSAKTYRSKFNYDHAKNGGATVVKYQLKGPETVNQVKVSSSGGVNSRKRKANTHWVHFSNFSSILYSLINSLIVLRRLIHINN